MNALNRTMSVERLSDGRLHAFVAPTGGKTVVSVTGSGMLESITDPDGLTAMFEYNKDSLMTSHKPPIGCKQHFK